MKMNSYAVLFLTVLFLSAVTTHAASLAGNATDGYYINMPANGTESLTIPNGVTSFKVYDDGGRNGLYSANAEGTLTIQAPINKILVLTGVLKTQHYASASNAPDYLMIYDGTSSSTTMLEAKAFSPNAHGEPYYITKISSSRTVTLYFKSNSLNQFDGFDLLVQVVSSSTETHSVSYSQKTGGTISASPTSAQIGSTISLSATTSSGYVLNGIAVQGTDGYPLRVTNDLWYNTNPSFVMRGTDVTVTPTYTTAKTKEDGLGIVLPRIGNVEATIPAGVVSFKVEDDGGYSEGNGASSENSSGYLYITAPTGKVIQVTGNVVQVANLVADTKLYDGGSENDPVLLSKTGTIDVGVCASSSNKLTFYHSGGNADIDLKVSIVDPTEYHNIETPDVLGGKATCALDDAQYHDLVPVTLVYDNTVYRPIGVTVTSSDGTPVAVNMPSSFGTYAEFEMPYGDVTVEPQFTTDWTADGGLYVNTPVSNTTTLVIPDGVSSFHVYDDGGKDGNFSLGADGVLVLQAPSGKYLQLKGSASVGGSANEVSIYDGDETGNELKKINVYGDVDIGSVFSSGQKLAIKLKSTTTSTGKGFDFVATVVDPSVKHAVDIPSIDGGVVSSNISSSGFGSQVVLTVTPESNEGYFLGDIKVVEEDGTPVALTKSASENEYTFTMPYSRVTVEPFFANPKIATFDNLGGLNNGAYFYLDCVDSPSKVCTIYQKAKDDTQNGDTSRYWYVEPYMHDDDVCVYDPNDPYAQVPLYCDYGIIYTFNATYANQGYALELGTSLDFGGRDANTGNCAVQFESISSPVSVDGNYKTVRGLCQKISYGNTGFITSNQNVEIKDITFKDAYIESTEGNVGVVAGKAGGGISISYVNVDSSTVKGKTNVGGLVGYVSGDVEIKNSSFRSANGAVSGTADNAVVGGLVGFAETDNLIIEQAFVESDVSVVGSATSGLSAFASVGGIAGKVKYLGNAPSPSATVMNTYSKGEIKGLSSNDTLGYIIGNLSYGISDNLNVQLNYHYGSDAIVLGIGGVFTNESWEEGWYGAIANVRNKAESLNVSGNMGYHMNDVYDYLYDAPAGSYMDFFATTITGARQHRCANGIASDADMKSSLFAALMNYRLEEQGRSALWVSKNDNELPTFKGTVEKPNHLLVVRTKGLSDEQKTQLGLVPVRDELGEYNGDWSLDASWYGLSLYTETATGALSSNDTMKIKAIAAAIAETTGLKEGSVMPIDTMGNAVSLKEPFVKSQVWNLYAPVIYDVVYQYCDGDPSNSTCKKIEDVADKAFIFMAPRIDKFYSIPAYGESILPMLSVLGEADGLQYDIGFLDASGQSVSTSTLDLKQNATYRLTSDVLNENHSNAGVVKTVVLKYWPSGNTIEPTIEIVNKKLADFFVVMSGDSTDGTSRKTVSKISTINGNGFPDNVWAPFSRYLDIACKAGYKCESYSASFSVTESTSCGNNSLVASAPQNVNVNYFATVEEMLSSVDGGCKTASWTVDRTKDDEPIDLTNVQLAYAKGKLSSHKIDDMMIEIDPDLVLLKYTVNFNLQSLGEGAYVVLGNNWTAKKDDMDVETNNEFPRLYLRSFSVGGGASSVNYMSMEWDPKDDATSGPHASALTSEFLDDANVSGTELTLYPYPPRVIAGVADTIRVIAVDEAGNAKTGQDDYHGSIVLTQKVSEDENTLLFKQGSDLCTTSAGANGGNEINTHCLYVPDVDDTLSFRVSLKPAAGYTMTIEDNSFKWQDPSGNPAEDKPGFGFVATGTDSMLVLQPYYMAPRGAKDQMYFKVKYTVTGPFYVKYDLNTAPEDEDKLFLPVDAKKYDTLAYSETVVSHDLWQPYRTDKCFAGWYDKGRTVTAGSYGAYKSLDAEYAAALSFSMSADNPTEVYAIWEDCATAPATGITIANGNTNAEIMLKQVLDGDEYEHLLGKDAIALPANSSGYKFFIDSANSNVALGFEPGKVSAEYDMNGTRYEFAIEGDSIVVGKTNVSEYFITMETPVSLYQNAFWLNLNADTVFFGTTFMDLEVHAQKDESIPMDIYRVGYKLKGWSFENGSTVPQQPTNLVYRAATHQAFDTEFENDYAMYIKTYNRLPDTLYAVWEKDDAAARRIVNLSPDVSSFRLMQDIYGMGFDYLVSDTLLLPAEGRFNFIMEMLYDPNDIEVDNMHAIVILDENGEVQEVVENNTMQSVEKSIGLKANILKDKRVKFVLNENSEDTVFFGSDWTEELTSENPDSALVLPTIVYNSEKCLAGWTLDSASKDLITVIDKNLLSDLRAKSKNMGVDISKLLYAKWTTNLDSCAGDFLKLALEQENGSVWFAESDKDKTIERRFTDEGTMFVPMELNGRNFRVQARGADTSVYVLDSLVVLRDGKIDTVLHEGDYMPEVLDNVTLKAYFGWKNKTEVAFKKVRLDSSGVMFRLNFKASDFEVRRIVSAKMQIFDAVKGSHVRTYDLGDTIAMGYDTSFVFHTDKTGEYKMVLSLKEEKEDEPKTFETKFSVSSKISAIAADGWQMLSLSAVDLSAVKNDGDQMFYWWDEHGTGEFWQYKKLNLKDSISPTLGVWYNSREGRELPLQKDIIFKDDDFVWKLDSVNTGWNMVANPYGWTLDLFANNPHAKKDFDEESEITFWRYNAGDWDPEPVTKILPYESVWAQVTKKKSVKWKVSAAPVFDSDKKPLEKRALAKATTKDRWTLQAKLADMNGKRDSWNILGAGLNPVTADEPPEYMGDHVNLTIVEGKRALAKSIKTASDEMEWNVALSASSDRVGYLSFAGIDGVNAFGYRVFVTVDGNTTEMREGEPLKVYLKSSARMATVRVAPAARVVAQNSLKGLRTARLGNRLQVTFDASGLVGTKARVDLLDMKGHVMSTVSGKTVDGSNALVLDAPQSGLYMLRVRAGSQQQATKIVVQ